MPKKDSTPNQMLRNMFTGIFKCLQYTHYRTLKANAQMGVLDWNLPERKRSLQPDILLNAGM